MTQMDQTVQFPREKDETITAQEIIKRVYEALYLKGYDPVNQLVGYIISGDPTYITSYNNARYLIRRIDRDELLEEVVGYYLRENMEDIVP